MRAMILAAGIGTRLLPLTSSCPKALVPLRGATMLEFWVERLYRCGFDAVFLNAYHHKDRLAFAVSERQWPIPVKVLNEPALLGTGGGIRSAAEHFGDESFAVINVDVVSDADLRLLYASHKLAGAEVSLLVHDWPAFNNVAVSEDGLVLGFGQEAQAIVERVNGVRLMAFTGIHFINPSALAGTAPGVPGDILDIYRTLIVRGVFPAAITQPGLLWREMGSVESYRNLTRELAEIKPGRLLPVKTGEHVSIHPDAVVHPESSLKGSVVAGRGTRICQGASLEDVILWDKVTIEKGATLKDCIVADGMTISGRHSGKIFVLREDAKTRRKTL
jgi:NDP-sugar pyrophosphorylase family protein